MQIYDFAKETADRIYRILDYNPAIVDLMLNFMYTGSYGIKASESIDFFNSFLSETIGSKGHIEDMTPPAAALFIHLEMNSIADFYDVYQLRETSVQRMSAILTRFWDSSIRWYPIFLEMAYKKTADANLHLCLVETTFSHLEELEGLVFGQGANLDVPYSFLSAVLAKTCDTIGSTKRKVEETRQRWEDMEHAVAEVFQPQSSWPCPVTASGCRTVPHIPIEAGANTFVNNSGKILKWNHKRRILNIRCQGCATERAVPFKRLTQSDRKRSQEGSV